MSTQKDEVEELMNSLLPLAKRMLAEHGEFLPYGGYIDCNGKITHVGGQIEGTDHPKPELIIDLLKKNFQQRAKDGKLRAAAVIFDVRIRPPGESDKTDAVEVCLDHQGGYSAKVLFPYTIKKGDVLFGTAFAHKGDDEIFGQE
jgi:hypothetical protein